MSGASKAAKNNLDFLLLWNALFDRFGAVSQLAKLGLSLEVHGANNFKHRLTIYFEVH